MRILHRSETIDGPRGYSDISITLESSNKVATITIHIDPAYASQSYAYATLANTGASILRLTTGDIGADAKAVAGEMIPNVMQILDFIAIGEKSS